MDTEHMFLRLSSRMSSIEAGIIDLNAKMNKLDERMSELQYDAILELFLVRKEIFERKKSLEREIGEHSSKAYENALS